MSSPQQLASWVRGQVFRQRERPLEKFVLRNASSGYKSGEVEDFDIPEEVSPDSVQNLVDQIITAAQRDADAAGTKLQTYMLMAIESGARTGPRHRFQIRGEGEEEDSGEERPDKEGLISQMMRHNEALMRMATMGAASTINQLTKQLEAANNTIAKLTEAKHESLALIEEAKSQQAEREMALLAVGNEQERKTEAMRSAMGKLDKLFPIILNKLAGKKMMNEQEASLLKEFVSTLQPEQLAQIASHLDAAQQIQLLTLYKEIKPN